MAHVSRRADSARHAAFTLVELLVVVAILAVLVALLLPAVQAARESARRGQCGNNLKQLAIATEAHKALIGHFPTGGWNGNSTPVAGGGNDWRQPGGWCYVLLPFMEQQAVYDAVNPTMPVPVFACPSRRGSSLGPGPNVMTDYAGNRGAWADPAPATNATGNRTTTFGPSGGTLPSVVPTNEDDWKAVAQTLSTVAQTLNASQFVLLGTGSVATGGVIFAGSSLTPALIRDGAQNTYLFAEKYVPRTAYATGTTGYGRCAYVGDSSDNLRGGHRQPESDGTPWNANLEGAFGGPHAAAFMAAMCDGSVKTIDLGIDPAVHFLLACRADRQTAQVPD
jgi:prepilin-type N-terminal cleavage/methylation domain-containing protein